MWPDRFKCNFMLAPKKTQFKGIDWFHCDTSLSKLEWCRYQICRIYTFWFLILAITWSVSPSQTYWNPKRLNTTQIKGQSYTNDPKQVLCKLSMPIKIFWSLNVELLGHLWMHINPYTGITYTQKNYRTNISFGMNYIIFIQI